MIPGKEKDMAYIDESYYIGEYMGSDVNMSEFQKLAERASDIVDALTYGKSAGFSAEEMPECVKKAVAAEVEYLAAQGGISAYTGMLNPGVTKETIGSYSYEKSGGAAVSVGGIPVSPLALSYLDAEGLRCSLIG